MPWEKQFEREDVLEKAMQAFWQHGYDGTSMKDLIACMGLNPGSIYASFGDKKSLFCEALGLYETQAHEMLEGFETSHTPRMAILAVFENLVDDVRSGHSKKACFLINSIIDAAPKDDQIDRLAKAGLTHFEDFFRRMITAGQVAEEIPASIDVHKTARILIGLVIGGRVLGRGHFDETEIQDYLDHASSLLS